MAKLQAKAAEINWAMADKAKLEERWQIIKEPSQNPWKNLALLRSKNRKAGTPHCRVAIATDFGGPNHFAQQKWMQYTKIKKDNWGWTKAKTVGKNLRCQIEISCPTSVKNIN